MLRGLRLLSASGSPILPDEGIPFTLEDTSVGGFRFVTKVQGVPLILDTGSSGLIFCNAVTVADSQATGVFGCNNYGIEPTPTNLPTLYGAATEYYQTPAAAGLSLESLGTSSYMLDQDTFYQVAVSESKDLNFCVNGLGGIFGLAGDYLNEGCSAYVSFPVCTVIECRGTAYYIVSAFPQLVGQNDWIFSIYLDYTEKKGQLLLGTSAIDVTTKAYSSCANSKNASTTFEYIATLELTGFIYESGAPSQTEFGYYQTAFTSCGVRGQSQISVSNIPVVWDTGTEIHVFPTHIYKQISASSAWLDCHVATSNGGGSIVLSIDLSIDRHVSAAQGISFPQDGGASNFILGVPAWAQWYTVFDLNAATLAIYTPPSSSCKTKPKKKGRGLRLHP